MKFQTSNSIKNGKSVNLSSRIDKNFYDELVSEAEKKGISLNSLVNSVIKHHVTWKRFADEIGFIPVTKRLVGKIFKHLDDESIKQIASEMGGTVPRELLFLTYDRMDFENLMQILEINSLRFGIVKHTELNGIHKFNIHHGISENFSKFLAYSHIRLADDAELKVNLTNLDRNMICLEFEQP